MPVTVSESKVSVELANGSVVEILLFGANVISWTSPNIHDYDLKERFFLSKKSVLDGSKPVSLRLGHSLYSFDMHIDLHFPSGQRRNSDRVSFLWTAYSRGAQGIPVSRFWAHGKVEIRWNRFGD
jgi:hypothetical protein